MAILAGRSGSDADYHVRQAAQIGLCVNGVTIMGEWIAGLWACGMRLFWGSGPQAWIASIFGRKKIQVRLMPIPYRIAVLTNSGENP